MGAGFFLFNGNYFRVIIRFCENGVSVLTDTPSQNN